jgi:hypothetical protein
VSRPSDLTGDTKAREAWRTKDQAFSRVEQLKTRGMWPGVIRAGGRFRLTFDPAFPSREE